MIQNTLVQVQVQQLGMQCSGASTSHHEAQVKLYLILTPHAVCEYESISYKCIIIR